MYTRHTMNILINKSLNLLAVFCQLFLSLKLLLINNILFLAWRGNEGEIRKIIVNDFVWQEEADDELAEKNSRKPKEEITVHVAIFTVHLDGLRELYRQFLRLPDGAILEVFGDISTARMLPDVKGKFLSKNIVVQFILKFLFFQFFFKRL